MIRRLILLALLLGVTAATARAQCSAPCTISALNGFVTINPVDNFTTVFSITGTWSATLSFQFSIDGGANWFSQQATTINADGSYGAVVNSTTANGQWLMSGVAVAQMRIIATAYASGTATVAAYRSAVNRTSLLTNTTGGSFLGVNVGQFGGSAAVTGTGASGAGIPRVTLSNDSSLAANQSVNVGQFGGSAAVTGTGASGAGIPRVTLSNDSSLGPTQSSKGTLANTVNFGPNTGTVTDLFSTGPVNLYGYHLHNKNAAVCYLQTFNLAAASVTLGTTPPWLSIPVAPGVNPPELAALALANYATKFSYAATTDMSNSTGCGSGIQGLLFIN